MDEHTDDVSFLYGHNTNYIEELYARYATDRSLVGEATGRIAECLGDRDADEDIWELAGRDLAGDWHHVGVHLRSAMDGIDRGHLADAS